MSAVDIPALGLYGTWEAAHADCVALGMEPSNNTRMLVLLFASVCFCQTVFMASRAPRVNWEAVYLPVVETFLYGLAASGNGMIRLADGRVVPIARFCSWLITCPVMLFQVVAIHEVFFRGVPVRNMLMAATLVRTVFGIGASACTNDTNRWVMYFVACAVFLFELITVHKIFVAGLRKFSHVQTRVNNIVYLRILFLRTLFFVSWTAFPIIWVLSSTGLCVIGEDASILAYVVADFVCKNLYGIVNANTLFRVLDGEWEPESRNDEGKIVRTGSVSSLTYLEMLLARLRGQQTDIVDDETTSSPDGSKGDALSTRPSAVLKDVKIEQTGDGGYSRAAAKEAAQAYTARVDKMRNRNPEMFLCEKGMLSSSVASPAHGALPNYASASIRSFSEELVLSQSPGEDSEEAPRASSPVMASLLLNDAVQAGAAPVDLPSCQAAGSAARPRRGLSRSDADALVSFLELAQQLAAAGQELSRAHGAGVPGRRPQGEGGGREPPQALAQGRRSHGVQGGGDEAGGDVPADAAASAPQGGEAHGQA